MAGQGRSDRPKLKENVVNRTTENELEEESSNRRTWRLEYIWTDANQKAKKVSTLYEKVLGTISKEGCFSLNCYHY